MRTSGHSSRQRRSISPWSRGRGRLPKRAAPRSRRISPSKQREKPAMWNGRVLLGRNPVFAGDRFSASYFETDFASFLAWRDWGFPDPTCSTVSAWARCAAPTAPSCSARWASTPSNAGRIYFPSGTPDLDDIRDGMLDISGSVVRELEEETGLAPGEYRERRRLALHLHRTCGCDDPDAAGRYAGRSLARADRGQSRLRSVSRNYPPSTSCATRAISIRRCRALSRRFLKRSSLPNPDVQASPLPDGLRAVVASNALDIWSRYQCDRRQQEQ